MSTLGAAVGGTEFLHSLNPRISTLSLCVGFSLSLSLSNVLIAVRHHRARPSTWAGMGVRMLAAGIRVAVDLAVSINELVGAQQVTVIDIGGGLPANYGSDEWAAGDKIPTFAQYATHLKAEVPELFSGAFRVVTEFGQAMNAKCGFLASRVEWMKGSEEHPIAIIHFGVSPSSQTQTTRTLLLPPACCHHCHRGVHVAASSCGYGCIPGSR